MTKVTYSSRSQTLIDCRELKAASSQVIDPSNLRVSGSGLMFTSNAGKCDVGTWTRQGSQGILGRIGTDMTPCCTAKHFTSLLRLARNNKVAGGKVKWRGTQSTQNRAPTAFRIAAQSLACSDSGWASILRKMTHWEPLIAAVEELKWEPT